MRAQHSGARGTKKLDSYCLMTHIPVDEPVYRVHKAEEKDKLAGEPRAPQRSAPPEISRRPGYTTFEDRQQAEAHALNGGSLLIEGIAGTGKSTFARGIVERLKSMEKKVATISKNHVASSRIDGSTADV